MEEKKNDAKMIVGIATIEALTQITAELLAVWDALKVEGMTGKDIAETLQFYYKNNEMISFAAFLKLNGLNLVEMGKYLMDEANHGEKAAIHEKLVSTDGSDYIKSMEAKYRTGESTIIKKKLKSVTEEMTTDDLIGELAGIMEELTPKEQEKLTLTSEEQKKFDDFIKAEMAGTRPYPEIPAPSRCGSFTADMTFKQTYCEIFDALTALQDKMIVLAALHEREVRKAAETEETK